jgi:hypothetical protein
VQHKVIFIAEARHLPVKQFLDYANEHKERYNITHFTEEESLETMMVSSWYVNDLVDDFRLNLLTATRE